MAAEAQPVKVEKEKPKREPYDLSNHGWCCQPIPADVEIDGFLNNGKYKKNQWGFTLGVGVHDGGRKYWEDRHKIEFNAGDSRCNLSVFDGHNGEFCAHYIATNIFNSVRAAYDESKDHEKSLTTAFLQMEEQVLAGVREKGLKDGTTAVVAQIIGNKIICANVGDSRCVLSRKGQAVDLSVDHKPEVPSENDRIVKAGGKVHPILKKRNACLCFGEITVPQGAPRAWPGGFSVTRTLGDPKAKPPQTLAGMITAEPEIKSIDLTDDDELLILATDGFWDVLSSQEGVQKALSYYKKGMTPTEVAQVMADDAYRIGSNDNITVVVLFLHQGLTKELK